MKKSILILLSWLTFIGVIVLYAIETNSFNVNMIIFLIIVPTLLNLPLFFKSRNQTVTTFQLLMISISLLIFLLATITMLINNNYDDAIRWWILLLAVVGMASNIVDLIIFLHV